MTTFDVACPCCHAAQVRRPRELRLMVCTNRPHLSYYAWDCEWCGQVRRDAPPLIISALTSHRVLSTLWTVPAEALEVHTGPPLTVDDLLDLQLDLAGLTVKAGGPDA
ncbi:MAG: hypothetical protein JWM02_3653 [Frankiales bacterium]|nr:hypothetical protein [Frankiales bacterium]